MRRIWEWRKRIVSIALIVCMLLDSNMIALAEEVSDFATDTYEAYQERQEYQKQYDAVQEQVQPQQNSENDREIAADTQLEKTEETEPTQTREISLRLPDTSKYVDEKEEELTSL